MMRWLGWALVSVGMIGAVLSGLRPQGAMSNQGSQAPLAISDGALDSVAAAASSDSVLARGLRWVDTAGVSVLSGLSVLLLGAALLRWGLDRKNIRALDVHMRDLGALMSGSVNESCRLFEQAQLQPSRHRLRADIKSLLESDVTQLVSMKQVFLHQYGRAPASEWMSALARGERRLNRAWSASVDAFDDEMIHSLGIAVDSFKKARAILQRELRRHAPSTEIHPRGLSSVMTPSLEM